MDFVEFAASRRTNRGTPVVATSSFTAVVPVVPTPEPEPDVTDENGWTRRMWNEGEVPFLLPTAYHLRYAPPP